MNSAELVRAGRLEDGLSALQAEIRNRPEDNGLRIFLFQLDCVLGRWDKALTQLQVIASLDAEAMLLAQIFRPVIACELLRREVFGGTRTPIIFGEPLEWIASLVQACALTAQGNFGAAVELRKRAFEEAPATPGHIDGKPFEWIADADTRLGPLLEAIIEGKYYWVPFCRIAKLELGKPTDLRDVIWAPARFTWTNGGMVPGHIPVRYPDSEKSADSALALARKTIWTEPAPECWHGLGQRMFNTDAGEHSLLDTRLIELTAVAQPPAPGKDS